MQLHSRAMISVKKLRQSDQHGAFPAKQGHLVLLVQAPVHELGDLPLDEHWAAGRHIF